MSNVGAHDQAEAAVHLPLCDHRCLKDPDHVERGEGHFYGYASMPEGEQTALRLWNGPEWPRPISQVRRVGWLDQRGRVWLHIPPAADFDGGSLAPLMVAVDD